MNLLKHLKPKHLAALFAARRKDETTEFKKSPYQIDIDPNFEGFSPAFKSFYHNHFENSIGLFRDDVDTSFFKTMSEEEKEIAKRLIRNNLNLRQAHLFRAAGELKDEDALPVLYEQLNNNSDLSWLLSIGQAIWMINGDKVYLEHLRKLQIHPSKIMKTAHMKQVADFKDEESIEMLLAYLEDPESLVRSLALEKLNHLNRAQLASGKPFDSEYYLKGRKDEAFKKELLLNLQNLP